MCPLSFETTSNALTNWFMAPLLANMGSDGTVSPSHFSLSGPGTHRSGAQRTSVRAQPVSNFLRSSVNPASDRSKGLHDRCSPAQRNARNNPCPLASLTEGAALESTGQLDFKSISTEPGYPVAFGLGILAASAVTSVYFNPAPVLKSTTRSSA